MVEFRKALRIYDITRNGPAQARVMMKSVLSSAEHGRCPHKYQNWEQLLAFQYLRVG